MTNGKPRRRSIFGGLLLIVVGVLFLMHNFGWRYDLWHAVWRWWPVLLILWGLAKLYDHMMAQRTGESAPATISGGEIFLVFLLVMIFGGVGFVDWARNNSDRINWGWGNSGDWAPWERTYSFDVEVPAKAVAATAHIMIETDRGDVTIHPEDAAEIRVSLKKTIGGSDEEDAKRRGQQLSVSIDGSGDSYEVHTVGQGMDTGRARVDLEVHVPKRASVTVRSGKGNLQVIGLVGNLNAESRSGDVEVRDSGGDVSVDVTRGDTHIIGTAGNVKLSGRGDQVTIADVKGEAAVNGEFFGPIRIEKAAKGARFLSKRTDLTISQLTGRFVITSGRQEIVDVPGSVTLMTNNNDISMENVAGRIHIENRNGNVELRFTQPPKDLIDITDADGNVDLVLPSKSTFEIHASSTRSGEAYSDFAGVKQTRESGGTATLDGKVGAQGPVINVKTTHGSIRLRKSD